jgi:hypothetical protein
MDMKRVSLMAVVAITLVFVGLAMTAIHLETGTLPQVILSPNLSENVLIQGTARVLIRLTAPFASESQLRPGGVILQRQIIHNVQEKVIAALMDIPGSEVIHQYVGTPLLAMRIDSAGLLALQNLGGLIVRIDEQCSYLDAALCNISN